MKYITEDDVIALFTIVEERQERFIYRDKRGDYYIREGNKIVVLTTSASELETFQKQIIYVVRSKNDIISDILDEL